MKLHSLWIQYIPRLDNNRLSYHHNPSKILCCTTKKSFVKRDTSTYIQREGSAGITSALIISIPLSQEKKIRLLPRREYMFSSCWYFRLFSSSHMMLSPLWDAKRRYFHNRIDRWFLNIVNSNVSWYACWLIHHSISTLWSQEIFTHDGLRGRMQSDPNSSPLSKAIVRPFPLSLWIEGVYRKLARSYMKLLML